jgi:hypothetical protein
MIEQEIKYLNLTGNILKCVQDGCYPDKLHLQLCIPLKNRWASIS